MRSCQCWWALQFWPTVVVSSSRSAKVCRHPAAGSAGGSVWCDRSKRQQRGRSRLTDTHSLVAFPAINRTTIAWLERHHRLLAAFRTDCRKELSLTARGAAFGGWARLAPRCAATWTARWFHESALDIERLLTRRKNEFLSTVPADKRLVAD